MYKPKVCLGHGPPLPLCLHVPLYFVPEFLLSQLKSLKGLVEGSRNLMRRYRDIKLRHRAFLETRSSTNVRAWRRLRASRGRTMIRYVVADTSAGSFRFFVSSRRRSRCQCRAKQPLPQAVAVASADANYGSDYARWRCRSCRKNTALHRTALRRQVSKSKRVSERASKLPTDQASKEAGWEGGRRGSVLYVLSLWRVAVSVVPLLTTTATTARAVATMTTTLL